MRGMGFEDDDGVDDAVGKVVDDGDGLARPPLGPHVKRHLHPREPQNGVPEPPRGTRRQTCRWRWSQHRPLHECRRHCRPHVLGSSGGGDEEGGRERSHLFLPYPVGLISPFFGRLPLSLVGLISLSITIYLPPCAASHPLLPAGEEEKKRQKKKKKRKRRKKRYVD